MKAEESAFWRYITEKLNVIAKFEPKTPDDRRLVVKQDALNHLEDVLRQVCDGTMVYPCLEPDGDDGVCATWHANTRSLKLSVDADLEVSVIIRHPNCPLHQQDVDPSDTVIVQKMRDHLHELSAWVKHADPDWKNLYTR